MKLLNRITINMSLGLFFVISIWAIFFYFAIMKEVNDEVDDSLEDFSELLITRSLAGMELPRSSNGTNNQYYIREVSQHYIEIHQANRYKDSIIYIQEKREEEPARILKTFFKDNAGKNYELLVATPTIEKSDLKQAIMEWLFLLWISMLIVTIIVVLGMLKRNMRPLYVLLKWLDSYKIGLNNEPLHNRTSILEFQKLNEAVLRNVQRSEKSFEEQKQFIGNASHEIQTPLAICKNRLELLLENEDLTESQVEEIAKVLNTINGISRLNRSLLLLSKIDNGQFISIHTVDINNLIKTLLDDLIEVYEHMDLKIILDEGSQLILNMNETLASVMIMNLLKNAFIHNVKGGTINIIIRQNSLQILNSGIDKPLNETRIFQRFYHSSKKESSSGLGLAILKSICKLYGFGCNYLFNNGLHQFVIRK